MNGEIPSGMWHNVNDFLVLPEEDYYLQKRIVIYLRDHLKWTLQKANQFIKWVPKPEGKDDPFNWIQLKAQEYAGIADCSDHVWTTVVVNNKIKINNGQEVPTEMKFKYCHKCCLTYEQFLTDRRETDDY